MPKIVPTRSDHYGRRAHSCPQSRFLMHIWLSPHFSILQSERTLPTIMIPKKIIAFYDVSSPFSEGRGKSGSINAAANLHITISSWNVINDSHARPSVSSRTNSSISLKITCRISQTEIGNVSRVNFLVIGRLVVSFEMPFPYTYLPHLHAWLRVIDSWLKPLQVVSATKEALSHLKILWKNSKTCNEPSQQNYDANVPVKRH